MTAPEQAPPALAQLSRHARLALKRELAARCVELGIRVNDTTSPGRLAVKHDPGNSVQRPHLEAIDEVLVKMLAEPNRRQMIFTPPQIGKLVAHNTPVPTPAGWVNHGDLRPGDEVYHPSGKSVRVTAIGGDDYATMRVSTSDGGAVTVHPRHEWTVYDRNWKRWTTMETRQIAARKLTTGPVGKRGGRYVFQLPHRDPLEGVDTGLPIDPYTLGVWLGDGTSTKAAVTHHADDHYDLPYPESAQCVHRSTGVVTTYYRGGLYAELKALGVHGNKHIPASYLRASETSRRALLAGLIDSDGTIAKSGQVTFSNINKRLADGIVELVRTLGYRATVHTPLEPCTSSSGIVGKHTLYRVSFTPHDGIAPARLTRKASMSAFTATRRRTAITAIEQVAPTPGRCITVDAPDGLYLVGEHMIPTHNSTRISRWFPFWYLTERPRSRIILASYAASLAVTHGAATRDLVTMYGDDYGLRLKDTEATKASWMLHTGGGMRSVGVRGGLTGQPMDLGIIDDPVKDREQAESPVVRESVWDWYSSVWSTRKAPEAGEVLVMTRFHKDDLAGRLLDQDGRVEEGGEWHVLHLPALAMTPDPDKGVYPDPLGREPGEPISHPRIDSADIGGLLAHWGRARKAVTNRDWNALYQGTPFDAEGALLSADDVRDHTAPEPETWKRNVVGVDPSGGGRDTAGIVVVGLDREGRGWFRADYTGHMTSYEWPRQACMAAVEFDAERIVVETNFGGDQATTLVAQAWDELERKGHIPAGRLCPLIAAVTARKSKVLRAEPIAQAIKTGRLWFAQGADLKQLTDEWLMWEPGTTWSPGALDAGVYGATEVLPPLPRGAGLANPAKMSRGSAAPIGVAGRRIARR